MKVAIIHDWLTGMRGGEKCLEVFCELFPEADLYTLLHIKGAMSETIEQMEIKTSFIQKLPLVRKKYRSYLPLFPIAIEQFDLREYDLVISSSHCTAKGVITSPSACHICYCYTPMRYAWDLYHDYFGKGRLSYFSKRIIPLFINYLRIWDITSSHRVDYFLAISQYVAERIKKHYRRDTEVIYPPVDCSFFTPQNVDEDYYLIVTALAPYKRVDLAIKVFNELGWPLKIIGDGQERKKLRAMAKKNIEFLGWQSNQVLKEYYTKCKALIFPGKEDFGIVPLEAQACGRPVIAYGRGGVLETVEDGITGIFFKEQTVESLTTAIRKFERMPFDKEKIRKRALRFDRPIFKQRIKEFVEDRFAEYTKGIEKQC